MKKYQDKDWLYYNYVHQRREIVDIADELSVDRKTIFNWIKKFKLARSKYNDLEIEILCHNCKNTTTKNLNYLVYRIKRGYHYFFCSRECADIFHSKSMNGINNPNFKGKWYGPDPKTMFTIEQRSYNAKRYFEELKEADSIEFQKRMNKLNNGHLKYFSTNVGKKKRIECGIKSRLSQSNRKETSIERIVKERLGELHINYFQEKPLHFWVVDFYLEEYNLIIEVQGDYWHGNPIKYNSENLNEMQIRNKKRDINKRKYLEERKGYYYLEIWEKDIKDGLAKSIIKEKIDSIKQMNIYAKIQ